MSELWWRFEVLPLKYDDDTAWDDLYSRLTLRRDPGRHNAKDAAGAIVRQLRAQDVRSAVVEYPYHDRDFGEEYAHFFARTFRPGLRANYRYHFFTLPAQQLVTVFDRASDNTKRYSSLKGWFDTTTGQYCGFCVVRSRDASIGRTVISAKMKMQFGRLLGEMHSAYLFGVRLQVRGVPFVEQDNRTGSCAQVSLWMALRHLSQADRAPWLSIPALTTAATEVPNEFNARSVPIGSGGLDTSGMLRAVHEAGRIPHYYGAGPRLDDDGQFVWSADEDPISIACRYVDSDIPVILLVSNHSDKTANQNQHLDTVVQDAHAVTVIGYHLEPECPQAIGSGIPGQNKNIRSTMRVADWSPGLIVHNEEYGPNLYMPRAGNVSASESRLGELCGYSASDVFGVIVPLPDQVFLRPAIAEEVAWEFLLRYAQDWSKRVTALNPSSEDSLPEIERDSLVARTFLMRGRQHFFWLSTREAHPDLLKLAAYVHFPSHVWVTEFYRRSGKNVNFERVIGHVVADASVILTSDWRSAQNHAFLFGHRPGVALGLVTSGGLSAARLGRVSVPSHAYYRSFRALRSSRPSLDEASER